MNQKYKITTKALFEGADVTGSTPRQIQKAKELYSYLLESAEMAELKGTSLDDELDEGLLTGLLGAAAGAALGPAIGRALCKVLGVSEHGTLGKLLTSGLVCTAIGAELGR